MHELKYAGTLQMHDLYFGYLYRRLNRTNFISYYNYTLR